MKRQPLSLDLDSIPPKITRALEDGPDYRPDWRNLLVQEHLKDLNSGDQQDAEALARLDEILSKEPDRFVRDLLLFHCDQPCDNEEGIAFAVKCQLDSKTRSASAIKALVIANGSPERIAQEFGTTKENIETFEKLYFDARPYLKHRGWLRGICFPDVGPNAVDTTEARWFAVAFRRGWPGVEEVVLGQVPNSGQRTLQRTLSMLLGRVEDYFFSLEASGVLPSEKDIKAIVPLGRIHARGLLELWENPLEPEPSTDSPAIQRLKKLSPAQRERVQAALRKLTDLVEKKVLAQSEG